MKFLKVKIVEYISYEFPGFVSCVFIDAYGKEWEIIEKVPVLTSSNFAEEKLPIEGFYVAGEVISESKNIILFSTEQPWGIEAKNGETSFHVFADQLSDISSDN